MMLLKLEWTVRTDMHGHDHWTAHNRVSGGVRNSYEICTMQAGDFRVWGLMRAREKFVLTLDEARAVAEDDYRRLQRAEAWREYIETHNPPDDTP